jgi:anti-anti-sigma factor
MDGLSSGNGDQIAWHVGTDERGDPMVIVRGELDIATVQELDAAVAPIIEGEPARLVVDVSGLRFADSSAIAMWVRWAAIVGEIELRDPSPLLRRVIGSMGLAERLRLTT